MAHSSPNFRMANRLAAGGLDDKLAALRDEGLSYSAISARLLAEFGIEVSPPTIGEWLRSLPAPAADGAA